MYPLALNILRGVQFVFAVIVIGTVGYFMSHYSVCGGYYYTYCSSAVSGQAGFIIFDAVWTILALAYLGLVPIFMPKFSHPIVVAILDGITMLFWFSGSIALAVYTGVGEFSNDWYGSLQAGVAFSFFTWISFVVTFVFSILAITKGRSHGNKEENSANPELQHGVQA